MSDESEHAGAFAPISKLPIFLALEGRRAVLAGDTPGLAWKAELIASAGAKVTVYSAAPCAELRALLARGPSAGSLALVERGWREADLEGAALGVADLETLEEAGAFKAAGLAKGVLVNTVDKGATCDFYFGAVVSRTPIMIGATTDGTVPIMGQAIRRLIELALPEWLGDWAEFGRDIRPEVKRRLAPGVQRRAFWEAFTERALAAPLSEDDRAQLVAAIESVAQTPRRVAGEACEIVVPPDVDALALREIKRMQAADVLIVEAGVPAPARAFFRREATRLVVGRAGAPGEIGAEEVQTFAAREASTGRRVVILRAPAG